MTTIKTHFSQQKFGEIKTSFRISFKFFTFIKLRISAKSETIVFDFSNKLLLSEVLIFYWFYLNLIGLMKTHLKLFFSKNSSKVYFFLFL